MSQDWAQIITIIASVSGIVYLTQHSLNKRVDDAVKRLDSVENYLRIELPKMLTDHQNNIESRLESNYTRLSNEMREFYRSGW